MSGTYLRLDITVLDGWRAVVRAAALKLTRDCRRDRKMRAARKRFYRSMLAEHARAQKLVARFRL
ncbi:MAG: hypothetical protein ACRCTI_10450 [Beijerinckiaceae bacterium]